MDPIEKQRENGGQKSVELLTNWSKWLISINFLAATGCIVALKTAGDTKSRVGIFFFAAILLFSLSVICSTLFVFLLARKDLQQPPRKVSKFLWLAKLQWVFFTLGILFVLVWIGFLSEVF